jgi:Predicted membrane protein
VQIGYQHILTLLAHYGVIGLFILSFIEASFFPLPPYLLLIPMTLANPQFGLFYALVGITGSVLGGVFGYAIGARVGRPILRHLFKENHPMKLESVFTRYGGWVVAIGGLTPIPYKIFAIAAGVFRMQIFTFIVTSTVARSIHFLSGALLLIFYGPKVVGYLHHSFGMTQWIILAALVLTLFVLWHAKSVRRHFIPLLLRLKTIWQNWNLGISNTTRTISRFGWYLIAGATLIVFSFSLFLKLAHELLEHELGYFDRIMGETIIALRTPWLTTVMKAITNLGSTPVIVFIVASLTVLGIIYRRYLIDIIVLDLCVGGGLGLTETLKLTYQRARPPLPWLGTASGFSFPSGHALITMSLYGFLAYLIFRNLRRPDSALWSLLFVFLAFGVGISRVYLGVHFVSDVLAGWTIAIAWLGTCIAGREVLRRNDALAMKANRIK